MKLYLASSWKNATWLTGLAKTFTSRGHLVDCFCDGSNGRSVFRWTELGKTPDAMMEHDAKTVFEYPIVLRAFDEDKRWLDWAEAVILCLPCGRSAHLEAGYAKGQGKKLWIYGVLPKGEFDVMYGFADGIYRENELPDLLDALRKQSATKCQRKELFDASDDPEPLKKESIAQ